MKKISFILMALAMVMGMTQCKKDKIENNGYVLEGETYHISLTLASGSSDAKADVYPDGNIAPVQFKEGDVIHVAYDGKWVGELTCSGLSQTPDPVNHDDLTGHNLMLGDFSGDVTIDGSGKYLYFYFLGNKEVTKTESNSRLTVNISDQTTELPVISYEQSTAVFDPNVTSYRVKNDWLKNQCALVKFEAENIYDMSENPLDNNPDAIYYTSQVITLTGLENQVVINLGTNDFNWSEVSGGTMLYLPAASGAETLAQTEEREKIRYAIVPAGKYNIEAGGLNVAFNPTTDPYGLYGTYKLKGTIENNDYFVSTSSNSGSKDATAKEAKLDMVWHSGAFSISGSQKVVFSRGNVQYAARSNSDPNGTWRFAKHQYDWVGGNVIASGTSDNTRQGTVVYDETSSTNATYSQNENIGTSYYGWIDLFGWGTGNVPTVHWVENLYYTGTTAGLVNVTTWVNYNNADGFHDWGAHNFINSGTTGTDFWETISEEECVHLFDNRSLPTSGYDCSDMYGFGEITVSANLSVHGLIVLPDNFYENYTLNTMPNGSKFHRAEWSASEALDWPGEGINNVFDIEQWHQMERYGALFLPAAGYRCGTYRNPDFDGGSYAKQNRGCYWLNDIQGTSAAWGLGFGNASGDGTWLSGVLQGTDGDLGNDHVSPMTGFAPDNGRSVRLVHRL